MPVPAAEQQSGHPELTADQSDSLLSKASVYSGNSSNGGRSSTTRHIPPTLPLSCPTMPSPPSDNPKQTNRAPSPLPALISASSAESELHAGPESLSSDEFEGLLVAMLLDPPPDRQPEEHMRSGTRQGTPASDACSGPPTEVVEGGNTLTSAVRIQGAEESMEGSGVRWGCARARPYFLPTHEKSSSQPGSAADQKEVSTELSGKLTTAHPIAEASTCSRATRHVRHAPLPSRILLSDSGETVPTETTCARASPYTRKAGLGSSASKPCSISSLHDGCGPTHGAVQPTCARAMPYDHRAAKAGKGLELMPPTNGPPNGPAARDIAQLDCDRPQVHQPCPSKPGLPMRSSHSSGGVLEPPSGSTPEPPQADPCGATSSELPHQMITSVTHAADPQLCSEGRQPALESESEEGICLPCTESVGPESVVSDTAPTPSDGVGSSPSCAELSDLVLIPDSSDVPSPEQLARMSAFPLLPCGALAELRLDPVPSGLTVTGRALVIDIAGGCHVSMTLNRGGTRRRVQLPYSRKLAAGMKLPEGLVRRCGKLGVRREAVRKVKTRGKPVTGKAPMTLVTPQVIEHTAVMARRNAAYAWASAAGFNKSGSGAPKVMADIMESITGAVYLDSGRC